MGSPILIASVCIWENLSECKGLTRSLLTLISEDGSSILVRQCSTTDWGSHCGLIHYEAGGRIENIDGCLEACDYDGCNSATKHFNIPLTLLLAFLMLLLLSLRLL